MTKEELKKLKFYMEHRKSALEEIALIEERTYADVWEDYMYVSSETVVEIALPKLKALKELENKSDANIHL